MRCQEVLDLFEEARGQRSGFNAQAQQHLAGCERCRDAWRAMQALRAERHEPLPEPPVGAVERAVRIAAQGAASPSPRIRTFCLGAVVGASLAAGILLAVIAIAPMMNGSMERETPQVTLAVNEPREVSIALDSPARLTGAEIRVVLNGAIGLLGFEGQSEIIWQTDLERGVNKLTLPVVALGTSGGQLLVEVTYAERRRTFLLDVHAAGTMGATDGSPDANRAVSLIAATA